jgi:23S rRNA (guanosine2251-2'-O)-methyltransferase
MERTKPRRKDFRQRKPAGASPARSALPQERAVFGLHAAEAALRNPKRTIRHAYLTENASTRLGPLAAARKIPVTALHSKDFDALIGAGAVHQGAVLDAVPLEQPSLDEFLDALPEDAPVTLAMLDQVTDPHNVGAVLRSAAAFGVAGVIMQDRHSPPLSGTLAKASSGGIEHVAVIATVNLARALERLKEAGFFCLGFDSGASRTFDAAAAATPRTAFVFGAEDKGLRRLVGESCDELYALHAPGKIKSLNISNAAAIVFYEASKTKPS